MPYDSTCDTNMHIAHVQQLLHDVIDRLFHRANEHDASKLSEHEKPYFDAIGPEAHDVIYGSPDYVERLEQLRPALGHHYAINSHHPEHYARGVLGMSLLDMVEMLADWKATCERSWEGDLIKSLDATQRRFGYSNEFKTLFLNTAHELGWLTADELVSEQLPREILAE